jgi:anti-sigma factor RsiW
MADILQLADAAHARSEVLLPWYVNGTLDVAERAFVESHIAQCERCRSDLARLRTIAEDVRELDIDPDRDLALGRLSARLDAGDPGALPDDDPVPVPVRRRGLSALWGDARVLRVLVVVQVGALAALGAIGLRTVPEVEYRTLAAPAASTDRGRLIVAFDSAQPEVVIRRVLVAADARVVDGPTGDGLYVVEVAAARAPAVAEQLRQSGAVVRVDLATPSP